MFPVGTYFMSGLTSKKALRDLPDLKHAIHITNLMTNSPETLIRFMDLYPNAWAMAADMSIGVGVSFFEDLEEVLPPGTLYTMVGIAEERDDSMMQIQLTVSQDHSDEAVCELLLHEYRHVEDYLSGRLSIDVETGVVTWDGVEHQAIVLPNKADTLVEQATFSTTLARYFAQPWEARANEGLWGKEFPTVRDLIDDYGTTWPAGLVEQEVIDYIVEHKVTLYRAIKALLSAR